MDVEANIVLDTSHFNTKQPFELCLVAFERMGIKTVKRTDTERGRSKKWLNQIIPSK